MGMGFCTTATQRKWDGISSAGREGENIKYYFTGYLGTICADKKTFIAYSAFGVDFATGVHLRQNERLEKGTHEYQGFVFLSQFGGMCAATDAFELLILLKLLYRKNKQPAIEASWVRGALSGA